VANFVTALTQLFSGDEGPEFIGVVGIGAQIGQATRLGLPNLLFFSAILSISLGLINLLPIPALDGSHLLFLVLEKLRGRPVAPEKESLIHFLGFALLMLLAIFITYRDILRLT
jgi:regulator of sigma E protease